MLGEIIVCWFVLEFYYLGDISMKYSEQFKAECRIAEVWPQENDGRTRRLVDCSETFGRLRLTEASFNTPRQPVVLEDDCE